MGGAILSGFLAVMAFGASPAHGNLDATDTSSPLRPATGDLTASQIFAKLIEHNHRRDSELDRYSVLRTYEVSNLHGKVYAREVVQVDYAAPDKKIFKTQSERGSWLVRHLVLQRLIEAEEKSSSGKEHHDSSIAPHNYSFTLVGEQRLGPYDCYVVEAIPRRIDKYLFGGRIWVDKQDFAVVKIAGSPVNKFSFWIEHVDFVRQYQKFGPFWLPSSDETFARIRFNGTKVLSIRHRDYSINGRPEESARTPVSQGLSPERDPQPQMGTQNTGRSDIQNSKIILARGRSK